VDRDPGGGRDDGIAGVAEAVDHAIGEGGVADQGEPAAAGVDVRVHQDAAAGLEGELAGGTACRDDERAVDDQVVGRLDRDVDPGGQGPGDDRRGNRDRLATTQAEGEQVGIGERLLEVEITDRRRGGAVDEGDHPVARPDRLYADDARADDTV